MLIDTIASVPAVQPMFSFVSTFPRLVVSNYGLGVGQKCASLFFSHFIQPVLDRLYFSYKLFASLSFRGSIGLNVLPHGHSEANGRVRLNAVRGELCC